MLTRIRVAWSRMLDEDNNTAAQHMVWAVIAALCVWALLAFLASM